MNKFKYEVFANEDTTSVCFNKKYYTEEEAQELGLIELNSMLNIIKENLEVTTGFISFGYYRLFCERQHGWSIDFGQTERKRKNEVEVWVVIGYEN